MNDRSDFHGLLLPLPGGLVVACGWDGTVAPWWPATRGDFDLCVVCVGWSRAVRTYDYAGRYVQRWRVVAGWGVAAKRRRKREERRKRARRRRTSPRAAGAPA